MGFILAACGQDAEQADGAPPASAKRAAEESPSDAIEEWIGQAGGWQLRLRLEGTVLNGTAFQQGEAKSNQGDCMAVGKVAGNTNEKGGVNWVAVGQNMEFVISGNRTADSITGTFESSGGAPHCNVRVPVTLTRQQAS